MAITTVKEKVVLKLELDNGIVDGKQKIQSKTFNKVRTDVADEDLHGVEVILADLQSKELLKVKKVDEVTLVSE